MYKGGLIGGKYFCEWHQDKELDSQQKLITLPKDNRIAYLDDGKKLGYILTIDSPTGWTELRLWPRQVVSDGNPYFDLPALLPYARYGPPGREFLSQYAANKSLRVRKMQGIMGSTGIFEISYSWEDTDLKGGKWEHGTTCLMDKTRGCLLTRWESRSKHPEATEAVPIEISELTYKRYLPGLFLPKIILQTEYDKATGRKVRVRKIRLSYKSIGKPMDDRFFTVDALRVPLGTKVHDDCTQPHRGWIFGEPRGAKERAELIARTAPGDARSMLEKRASYDFSGTPLTDVSALLGDYSGLRVILDPKIAKRHLSVTLTLGDVTMQTALDWVVTVTNLDYTYHHGGIFISDAKTVQKISSEGGH